MKRPKDDPIKFEYEPDASYTLQRVTDALFMLADALEKGPGGEILVRVDEHVHGPTAKFWKLQGGGAPSYAGMKQGLVHELSFLLRNLAHDLDWLDWSHGEQVEWKIDDINVLTPAQARKYRKK